MRSLQKKGTAKTLHGIPDVESHTIHYQEKKVTMRMKVPNLSICIKLKCRDIWTGQNQSRSERRY